eukprot:5094972-Prymnesium_polylepis.2
MPCLFCWPIFATVARGRLVCVRVLNSGALGSVLGHVRNAWNFERQLANEAGSVECLAALLKDNTALLSIDLRDNDFDAEGCKAIMQAICSSRSLC